MFCRGTQMVILFCARFYGQSFDITSPNLRKVKFTCVFKVSEVLAK